MRSKLVESFHRSGLDIIIAMTAAPHEPLP
jgi:hypothetical protein